MLSTSHIVPQHKKGVGIIPSGSTSKSHPQSQSSTKSSYFHNANYQENFIATYQIKDNISNILHNNIKTRLETFFSSQDFAILCLDFYILLASFKKNEHFDLDLLISNTVATAKNNLLRGKPKQNSEKKQKQQKPNHNNIMFNESELRSMFTAIFTNLSKNKLNVYLVRSLIYHPNFELSLRSSTAPIDTSKTLPNLFSKLKTIIEKSRSEPELYQKLK
ncbi:MAG: hypothetical protein ACK5Z5_04165 [Neisseriaceae bacterium]